MRKNTLKIKKTKKDKCPICNKKIGTKNGWVKYHISYNPEMTILACKFCNFTEFVLRNKLKNRNYGAITPYRIECVLNYQKRFGIII